MTVAFDKFTHLGTGTGNISATHTPVGTPRGALVYVISYYGTAGTPPDEVSAVSYGGVSMAEVPASPVLFNGAEDLAVYAYFLGASVPTGAQTVEVSVSGSTTKVAYCYTITADADTEVVDDLAYADQPASSPIVLGTLALSGRDSFVSHAVMSAGNTDSTMAPATNWTERHTYDFGSGSGGTFSYNLIGSTDVGAQFVNSDTNRATAGIAAAIAEIATGGPPTLTGISASGITSSGATLTITAS